MPKGSGRPKRSRKRGRDPQQPQPAQDASHPRLGDRARLHADAVERYRCKQVRREVLQEFEELRAIAEIPKPESVRNFLSDHLNDIVLVREALAAYRHAEDAWALEVWRLLGLTDADLLNELAAVREERAFAVEAARMLVQHKTARGLSFQIPTSTEGPEYGVVGPEEISKAVADELGPDAVPFVVKAQFPFRRPGRHEVVLRFQMGEPLRIDVNLVLVVDEVPEDLQEVWGGADMLPLESGADVRALLREQVLKHPEYNEQTQLSTIRVLKTAHALGYWKTVEAQQLAHRWRAGDQALKLAAQAVPLADVTDLPTFHPSTQLRKDEAEKLRILRLPPLVTHDLMNAIVDLNVLRRLFLLPQFAKLRKKALEDLTESDIRSLSPTRGGSWRIRELRRAQRVDSRALAKMLLSIARLHFEKLETGTCASDIRFSLSNYSTRMGEYLVQQHGRYDLARDYYLEAITLNLGSERTRAASFPTKLLFRSFPDDSRVPFAYRSLEASPGELLDMLDGTIANTPTVLETAVRSFLELGARHFLWASRWFAECPQTAQRRLLSQARSQLGLGDLADFSDCVRAYCQECESLQALLRQMGTCSSLHGVVQTGGQLDAQLKGLGFLLSPTNREIAGLLLQATDAVARLLQAKGYEGQRANADAAINLLERVLQYGADNYTALWAEHLGAIAQWWRQLVAAEITGISRHIAPVLGVTLAERRASLFGPPGGDQKVRVIYRIENSGSGGASRANVSFRTRDGQERRAHRQDLALGSGEVAEDFVLLEDTPSAEGLDLDYRVSYYDPDRQFRQLESEESLHVLPLIDSPRLHALCADNPFRTDQEVEDERMFVGRDQLLEEVGTYAIDQPRGSLLMLYGQRRVGKSSLLRFLEREVDAGGMAKGALGVRVTWLEYTDHAAPDLMYEIAGAIQEKYREQYRNDLETPGIEEFRLSYSLAFNNVLRELKSRGMTRLILMWDEFDGLVNHLEKPEKGFDRVFYEYLRGLSKRQDVALVLTGGELMPILFEQWGEVFNHDRTWRIAYLSPADGSVEKLVRNEYVRGVLEFSDDAVGVIKEYSACNPFFVQMICRELVSAAALQQSTEICRLDVEEILTWLVQKGLESRYVRHLYCPRLKPDPLDMAVIGVTAQEEVSRDRHSYVPQDIIMRRITAKRENEVVTRVGELVRREILQRNPADNAEVRMMLPLFRDWFYDNSPEYQLWAPLLRR